MTLFIIFAIWRVGLFVWSYFISVSFAFTPSFPYSESILAASGLPRWIWSFANFDGVHYLNIARNGYFAQFTQAFFPLYPYLTSVVGSLVGEGSRLMTGLTLSLLFFYTSLFVLKKLLELDLLPKKRSDNRIISQTLWFLLIFPTSFYFASYYTESLFLLLSLLCFYLARTRRWVWCGLFAALASATKITGVVLIIPLLYEWLLVHYISVAKNIYRRILQLLSLIFKSPILYLTPLGIVGYMVYLHVNYQDALYFWHAQSAFGAQRSGDSFILPLQTVFRYLKMLLTIDWFTHSFWVAVFELAAVLCTIVILVYGHKLPIRKSYLWYSWILLIIPMCTGTLSSIPRYILVIFPIYMILGTIKNKIFVLLLSFISIGLLLFVSAQFFRGNWVA